jgi:AAA ATPase domain
MLATTLTEALNALAPERALTTRAELHDLYVSRPSSALRRLELLLRSSHDPQKVLFTGHRGSGKTTELARLGYRLEDQFFIFRYSVSDRLNIYDITYLDVLLALGLEMFDAAAMRKLSLNSALYEQMLALTKEVSTTVISGSPFSGQVGGELNFLIGKLNAAFKVEDKTRKEVREKASPRLSTLLDTVDQLARAVEAETGKHVLAVVEDLDKVDPGTAKQLFYDHGASLGSPTVSIIYTFPIALRHDNNFLQVKMNFPKMEMLPIFKTRKREGAPDEEGIAKCAEILTRRVRRELFAASVTRTLAEASGGVPRLLIALASQACLEAMVDDEEVISDSAVQRAVQNSRRDYEVLLTHAQISALRKVHRTKEIENDEEHRELLHNLSCLEYRNEDVWYDVHPVVEPLLVS